MEKIQPENAVEISRELGRETYCASPFLISVHGYYERQNGELAVFFYDSIDKKMRYLMAPNKPKAYDVEFAQEEDIERLRRSGIVIRGKVSYGPEYIYNCKKLSESISPDLAQIRRNANYFRNHFSYSILNDYDPEKVKDFIKHWASTKRIDTYTQFARNIFLLDLDLCLQYVDIAHLLPHRNIYVEIDGVLAGFAFTHPLTDRMFVGLMQKVDVRYRGLSPFIYQEKAKLYPGVEYFTIGCPCDTPGLLQFKNSLRPARLVDTYLVTV